MVWGTVCVHLDSTRQGSRTIEWVRAGVGSGRDFRLKKGAQTTVLKKNVKRGV